MGLLSYTCSQSITCLFVFLFVRLRAASIWTPTDASLRKASRSHWMSCFVGVGPKRWSCAWQISWQFCLHSNQIHSKSIQIHSKYHIQIHSIPFKSNPIHSISDLELKSLRIGLKQLIPFSSGHLAIRVSSWCGGLSQRTNMFILRSFFPTCRIGLLASSVTTL